MKTWMGAAVATIAISTLQMGAWAPDAMAQGIKTGVLTCQAASGFGWILGSTRTMECKYESGDSHTEEYTGTISKVGIDIGYLGACVIVWAVVAPHSSNGSGALAGNYIGATAQAAGVGGGVNVMTGGFHNSIALQPISLMGNTGLYVGAGIGAMTLQLSDY
jgi:hypothetical protein